MSVPGSTPQTFTIPYLDLSSSEISVVYDRMAASYPKSYVSLFFPASMEMAMGGTFLEIVAPERIVNTELFDDPWYQGEGHATAVLTERNGWTTLSTTVRAVSREARDTILRSGMDTGVAAAYDTLERVLAAQIAASGDRR